MVNGTGLYPAVGVEAGDNGAQGAEAENAESADGGAPSEEIEKGVD